MGTGIQDLYEKSHANRLILLTLAFIVFISILFYTSAAGAAIVDITLEWDASAGATGYKLFYHEEGQNYNYSQPACNVTNTTCTVSGLDDTGTYYFVARAYNADGQSGNSNEEWWVKGTTNQSPTASISTSPTSGIVPLQVSFDGSNSADPDGTIFSYDWNFGDGATGTGVSTSHTYNSGGHLLSDPDSD